MKLLKKRINLDYRKGSIAREDYYNGICDFFRNRNIAIKTEDMFKLVDAYSEGDTETMTEIFLKIIDEEL